MAKILMPGDLFDYLFGTRSEMEFDSFLFSQSIRNLADGLTIFKEKLRPIDNTFCPLLYTLGFPTFSIPSALSVT